MTKKSSPAPILNTDEVIYFTVQGNPKPKERPRFFRNKKGGIGTYTPKNTASWEGIVKKVAEEKMKTRTMFLGSLGVVLYIRREDARRADFDNLAKAILDSCNKVVYKDDHQLKATHIQLVVDKENPGIDVFIFPHYKWDEYITVDLNKLRLDNGLQTKEDELK